MEKPKKPNRRPILPPGPGRPKGLQNKATREFKDAIVKLLDYAAPEMVKWLKRVAKNDPDRALELVGKLGEFAFPKLARTMIVRDPDDPIPPPAQVEHRHVLDLSKLTTEELKTLEHISSKYHSRGDAGKP